MFRIGPVKEDKKRRRDREKKEKDQEDAGLIDEVYLKGLTLFQVTLLLIGNSA